MGQYYRIKVGNKLYYPDGSKLMEHSYIPNKTCNYIISLIFDNPQKVAWIGDYTYMLDNPKLQKLAKMYYNPTKHIKEMDLIPFKYLVNNTKKEYIDIYNYIAQSVFTSKYLIHPLPLLTVTSNGLGIGDYRGDYESHCGDWCNDEIYATNTLPNYTEINYIFIER